MMIDREELEQLALATCSAELTYDLRDTIDSLTDEELLLIIDAGGDYRKELEAAGIEPEEDD